jgi:hypothetical protein
MRPDKFLRRLALYKEGLAKQPVVARKIKAKIFVVNVSCRYIL